MYFPVGTLAAVSLLAGTVAAAPTPYKGRNIVRRTGSYTTYKPTAFTSPSEHKATSNYLSLSKVKSKGSHPRSAAYVKRSTSSGSSSLISLFEGEEFATSITIGSDSFDVIVDTGSSDTWVVEKGFTCIDLDTGRTTSESSCDFGSTWTVESSFKEIQGEEFAIEYGDGEYLYGVLGNESVTLAGITVDSTTIAVVNEAAWEGDGTTSGLTGLAYPALTSAYSTSTDDQVEYSNVITTMIADGLIDPYFSLAISRDVSGDAGYLALGGLPPVDFVEDFTNTSILVTSIEGYPDSYDFYTINIDAMTLNGKSLTSAGGDSIQYIVDSGTTLNYYPTAISEEVNAAFSPAATYSEDEGAYIVDCDATAPSHGITINGKTFYINALDMILDAGTDDEGNTICISGIVDGGSDSSEDLYILGDTFQKNVVTVFDIGATELRFAARENYTSNDTY
ncbi:acid protease [Aspergillus ibericus CBS 121593]|uniref:Acid protease n=1 Tax=Aspergillus ibericus CBS 121593 TaxID=1448316 RepID=A0A395GPB3_9EURO|nr:acid protease [Aspergillus ibericus CBS 121593]RAK97350.1 acid protease [Aspergillus ibericus CBS 121593]